MKYPIIILSTILAGFIGFIVASCGADSGAEAVGDVPSAQGSLEAPAVAPTTSTSAEPIETVGAESFVSLEVWYTSGESLHLTHVTVGKTARVGTAALEFLLLGPQEQGVGTAIPAGTRLLGLDIDDGIATADLTSEFESGGGSLSMTMRLAQVVYTLTQFPTIDGVRFELDGQPVDVFSGEGIVLDHPVTRKDYADLLPVILVESPVTGERVGNPVTVSGSANVFEANVTVRILGADGQEIARTFTTATCGTGCRGDYSVSVPYDVEGVQPGTIVVQDDDAAGEGFPPHEVRVPVTLTPSA